MNNDTVVADSNTQAAVDEVAPIEIVCPGCGSKSFKYNVTYSTLVVLGDMGEGENGKTGTREQSNEELRCTRCEKKVTMAMQTALRQTEEYKLVRRQEDNYN